MAKLTSLYIETLVARRWNIRQHTIVPNVSWGLGLHECDVLIVSKSGYATEVEIKVSKSDLKKDAEKRHGHINKKIKDLYFAIPEKLLAYQEFIPEHAGILVVKAHKEPGHGFYIEKVRDPISLKNAVKLTDDERRQLMRLGCMRIWRLKETILSHINDKNEDAK